MAVAISSRSSDRTRRTMFSSACSNGRPRLTSRMTRANSIEIGGRVSRTTSSMAWRNDDPARSALAISVIVSGSCLLNAPSRPLRRRASQNRGRKNPTTMPISRTSGFRSVGTKADRNRSRSGTPTIDAGPDRQELGRLEMEVGARDVARDVGPEVAPLDGLVEAREGLALGDQLGNATLTGRARGTGLWPRRGVPLEAVGDARPPGHRDAHRDDHDGQGEETRNDQRCWCQVRHSRAPPRP